MTRRKRIHITRDLLVPANLIPTVNGFHLSAYRVGPDLYRVVLMTQPGGMVEDIAEGTAKQMEQFVDRHYGLLIRLDIPG